MLFNSFGFIVFFPIVTLGYFLLPHRFRWLWLLSASCVFYIAFIPAYILILLFTIVIDYFAGLWIEASHERRRKRLCLTASIVANMGILGFFKYFNFFNANLAHVAQFFDWNYSIKNLSIILPIGLSFHTFQAMSYTIEVYRGRQRAERNFGIYALYVMFYPQLVAGPIERPQNLIHQFYERHDFDYERVTDGLKLMAWGMFKKVVIADRLALFVNHIYGHPRDYHGTVLLMATIFFAFQIFCDFSGYSDIAIGAAKVMGFTLMKNFDRPYFSESIPEFWRRWHISLSTWFRDFVYISLGGNRVSMPRWYLNLMIVFLISGFWHGANWTFIVWGALHGFYCAFYAASRAWRNAVTRRLHLERFPSFGKVLNVLITFSLTCFAWIFFRAASLSDAFYISTHLFMGLGDLAKISTLTIDLTSFFFIPYAKLYLSIALVGIVLMELIHFIQRDRSFLTVVRQWPGVLRWSAYYSLVAGIFIFGSYDGSKFIYFQF